MKKLLFILLLSIFLIPCVNAETVTFESTDNYNIYIENKELFKEYANQLINYYNNNLKSNYSYYFIDYIETTDEFTYNGLILVATNTIKFTNTFSSYQGEDYTNYALQFISSTIIGIQENQPTILIDNYSDSVNFFSCYISNYIPYIEYFKFLYDSNFNLLYNKNLANSITGYENLSIDSLQINNFYSDSAIIINHEDDIPLLKNLLEHDNFIDYEASQNGYIEVNLDNYEYVILNLKDYSKKYAFETNLQVKGSVAITPVYEFGTTEKENITDLCNLSYSDFTDYRFFVLKNDLINNAVYIVKECSDSGSSFRFDSNVFDITYVTAENVDDPVVTFGGVEYHTIPFNKLSNTVNKNEEEGFIPGESGSSLTDIVDNITSYITSFWNSLSTFMGLVTKFFNTLPIEIRAVAITTFTTACTLGLLKILKS